MKTFYRAKETGNQAVTFGDLFNSFDERCGDFLIWFIEERQENRSKLAQGFKGNEEDEWSFVYDNIETKYAEKFFEVVPLSDSTPPRAPHCSLRVLDRDEVEEDI
jgi:hypothetical protein